MMDTAKKLKVSFHTLGCKVNQYETQSMSEKFSAAGFEVVKDGMTADVYIINTCTVTNTADRKSRQFISRARKMNPDALIAVAGCYAQTSAEEAASLEGVDIVIGNNMKSRAAEYVAERLEKHQAERKAAADIHVLPYDELTEYEDLGHITAMESRSRAFIKIQDGCDRFCSYCMIPYARGHVRSRDIDDVIAEAALLIDSGYREIVLTGINTALYGAETNGRMNIVTLIAELNALKGDFRMRLSSLEPNVIDKSIAAELLKYDRLCHHMHLAIQSGSDSVLRRMNRRYTAAEFEEIAGVLRSADGSYGITTDIIAGFPGETEEEFEETLESVRRIGFSRVHAFVYSMRNGTAAAAMKDQIDGNEKDRRRKLLHEAAEQAAMRFYDKSAGQVRKVLFERIDKHTGLMEGYTDNYIKVYADPELECIEAGSFTDVRLLEAFADGMKAGAI